MSDGEIVSSNESNTADEPPHVSSNQEPSSEFASNGSGAFGIGGAYYVVIKLFGMNGNFFWKNLKSFMYLSSIVVSVVKAVSFGVSIAIVGCYKGFSVASNNGAEGVGRATTGSAVTAIMIILIIDFLLNHLLYAILGFK